MTDTNKAIIDKDLEERLASSIGKLIKKVFYAGWVQKVNRKKKFNRRVIVFTSMKAVLYKPKPFSSVLIVSRSFFWNKLQSLDSPNPQHLLLTFEDGSIEFKDTNYELILDSLLTYLHEIYMPYEMPKLILSTSKKYKPQKYSAIKRYKYYKTVKEYKTTKLLDDSFKEFVLSENSVLDITNFFDLSSFSHLVYNSLQISDNIKTVVLPETEDLQMYQHIARFLLKNSFVENIIIKGELNESLGFIGKALEKNTESKVKSLTYIRPSFSANDGRLFMRLIKSKPVSELKIDTYVSQTVITDFMKAITLTSTLGILRKFELNGAESLLLSKVVSSLSNVTHLSLTNCGGDLQKLFNALDKEPHMKIESIDFSGNHSIKTLKIGHKIPNSIQTLKLSKIDFANRNLLNLFKFIQNCQGKPGKLSIDLSNIILSQADWDLFFSKIRIYDDPAIGELNWSGNPLHENFFCFIHYSKGLRVLNIDGCLLHDDPAANAVPEFIRTNRYVRHLSINGVADKVMDQAVLLEIIDALGITRKLDSISLSSNLVDKEALKHLTDSLMKNRVLKSIAIDTNADPKDIKTFTSSLLERGVPLKITCPEILKFSGEIKDTIQGHLTRIEKGDSSIKPPKSSITKVRLAPPFYHRKIKGMASTSSLEQLDEIDMDEDFFEICVPYIQQVSNQEAIESLFTRMSVSNLTAKLLQCL